LWPNDRQHLGDFALSSLEDKATPQNNAFDFVSIIEPRKASGDCENE